MAETVTRCVTGVCYLYQMCYLPQMCVTVIGCVLPLLGVCYLYQVCVFRYPHSWGVEDQRGCGRVRCPWQTGQWQPVRDGITADIQPGCCGGYHANRLAFKPWDWQHHDDITTWKTDSPIRLLIIGKLIITD